MGACPQNGTSHSGEKYRTRHAPPSGAAKAVSENPTSAAIACISDADGKSSPIQIPAGLPPLWPSENAAMRRTVMLVILFPVHLPPPILISLGDSETRARQMHDDLADSIVVMPDRNVVAVR